MIARTYWKKPYNKRTNKMSDTIHVIKNPISERTGFDYYGWKESGADTIEYVRADLAATQAVDVDKLRDEIEGVIIETHDIDVMDRHYATNVVEHILSNGYIRMLEPTYEKTWKTNFTMDIGLHGDRHKTDEHVKETPKNDDDLNFWRNKACDLAQQLADALRRGKQQMTNTQHDDAMAAFLNIKELLVLSHIYENGKHEWLETILERLNLCAEYEKQIIGLQGVIDSQRQTHDALIKKLKMKGETE